jgi:hypothetical protein
MLQMPMGLERHQVSSEKTLQEFLTPREDREDFAGWKWDVEKKTDGCIRRV